MNLNKHNHFTLRTTEVFTQLLTDIRILNLIEVERSRQEDAYKKNVVDGWLK